MKLCPKGDDPLTLHDGYRTIIITTSSYTATTLAGSFRFEFNGEGFYIPAYGNSWSSALCKAAFESLPNIKTVSCTQGALLSGGATTYTVRFVAFPTIPYQNNIYFDSGSPSLSQFTCTSSSVTSSGGGTCTITDATSDATYPPGQIDFHVLYLYLCHMIACLKFSIFCELTSVFTVFCLLIF